MWIGLTVAYVVPTVPPSFGILGVATAVYLALEIYAAFRPEKTQSFLATARAWIDSHTDQVIVVISLVLGFWLIGKSIYTLVS